MFQGRFRAIAVFGVRSQLPLCETGLRGWSFGSPLEPISTVLPTALAGWITVSTRSLPAVWLSLWEATRVRSCKDVYCLSNRLVAQSNHAQEAPKCGANCSAAVLAEAVSNDQAVRGCRRILAGVIFSTHSDGMVCEILLLTDELRRSGLAKTHQLTAEQASSPIKSSARATRVRS